MLLNFLEILSVLLCKRTTDVIEVIIIVVILFESFRQSNFMLVFQWNRSSTELYIVSCFHAEDNELPTANNRLDIVNKSICFVCFYIFYNLCKG